MGILGNPGKSVIASIRKEAEYHCIDEELPIEHPKSLRYQFEVERESLTATVSTYKSGRFLIHADDKYEPTSISVNGSDLKSYDIWVVCSSDTDNDFSIPSRLFVAQQLNITSDQSIVVVDLNLPNIAPINGRTIPFDTLRYYVASLLNHANVKYYTIKVDLFKPSISQFNKPLFDRNSKTNRMNLFDGPEAEPNQRISIKVKPIKSPIAPPDLGSSSLEENIWALLQPPIHEILSDPQLALPARPYDYQTYGIQWLYDRKFGLLADEMGLGKTMQAIIAARLLWRDRKIKQILIVCPKILISNWLNELRFWWPGIQEYTKVLGNDYEFGLLDQTADRTAIKIINYEMLSRALEWVKSYRPFHDLIIIDEAQRIKNPKSKSSKSVKLLNAPRRWAITGTPLENRIEDYYSIIEFIYPEVSNMAHDWQIRNAIMPYRLRRKHNEVDIELPELTSVDIGIELSERQRNSYDQLEKRGVLELEAKGDNITTTHVFALIQKLRSICNFCPSSGESAKLTQLVVDLEEVVSNDRKALVFGYFTNEEYGLKKLARSISDSGVLRNSAKPLELHGSIPDSHRVQTITKFITDPSCSILLLNYTVGGSGHNLQVANYVFLFDRWWNPAVEEQALKRAHRIGQQNKVVVRKYYCKGTIEERILKKLDEKRRLFSDVIDNDRPEINLGFSAEEMFSLFDITFRPKTKHEKVNAPVKLVLDNITPSEFENLVAIVYEREGFQVQVTGKSHDGGIDIVATKTGTSARECIAIQCKRQKDNVGCPAAALGSYSPRSIVNAVHFSHKQWFHQRSNGIREGKANRPG